MLFRMRRKRLSRIIKGWLEKVKKMKKVKRTERGEKSGEMRGEKRSQRIRFWLKKRNGIADIKFRIPISSPFPIS